VTAPTGAERHQLIVEILPMLAGEIRSAVIMTDAIKPMAGAQARIKRRAEGDSAWAESGIASNSAPATAWTTNRILFTAIGGYRSTP
jgi:hypothetical protein